MECVLIAERAIGCVPELKAGLIRVQDKLVGWFWIRLKPIGNLRVLLGMGML